jgi:hypothetical protein
VSTSVNTAEVATDVATDTDTGPVQPGERNCTLWRWGMLEAPGYAEFEALLAAARQTVADHFVAPDHGPDQFTDREVEKTVRSAWGYEIRGENWIGHARPAQSEHAICREHPDAHLLFAELKERHLGLRDGICRLAARDGTHPDAARALGL